jgi:hypothetical protein
MMRQHQYSSDSAFCPLSDESVAAIHEATHRFLLTTRPHRHPVERLDGAIIAAELLALQENMPVALRGELDSYIHTVLSARTAGLARQLIKPEILQRPDKSNPLTESQQSAKEFAARLLYLRALDTGTAVMPTVAWSRVKSQTWQNWGRFDLGLMLAVRCPGCEQMAALTLRNLHDSTAYRFNCAGCGHQYRGGKDQSETADDCTCSLCAEHKNVLLGEIVQIIEASSGSMVKRYLHWMEDVLGQVEEWPSSLEMERAYKLKKDNLGKDIRGILSLRPADATDFESCVKGFLESHTGIYRDILDKALKAQVLYERQCPEVLTAPTALDLMTDAGKAAHYLFKGNQAWGSGDVGVEGAATILAKILGKAIAAPDLVVDASGITVRQRIQHHGRDGMMAVSLLTSERGRGGLLDGEIHCRWRTEGMLNPYFIGLAKSAEIHAEQLADNAEPLFNSRTEGHAYLRIADENPGCIVVPNRLLKRIANLGQFKLELEKREFAYAKDAEIDFAVYNRDGCLLFVEELQRGDHHNQPEWIWKDSVKRKVLRLAGIPLRESF